MSRTMNTNAIEELVLSLPSVHLRSRMLSHTYNLNQMLKDAEAAIKDLKAKNDIYESSNGSPIRVEIKEVVKEVIKEVVREVPVEVIREVVREVPVEVVREKPVEVIREVKVEVIREVEVEKPVVQEAQEPESKDEKTIREAEKIRIANWLDKVNPGETVRALYGRKMARLVREGEYRKK